MTSKENPRILIVDDDPNVLSGYQRALRKQFAIDVAESAADGLKAVDETGPYAVVVSDQNMPVMTGIEFLARLSELAPDTVRIMLTGDTDQQTAIQALNRGDIFRFLNKPCSSEELAVILEAALEQHRLLIAEKALLSQTLAGCVKVLVDVLSAINPLAFGKASRVRRLSGEICDTIGESNWQINLAAILSQLGCVQVPQSTLIRLRDGVTLPREERQVYESHPKVGQELLTKIPRLEDVAKIVGYQEKRFDGSGFPEADSVRGENIPLGARVLKLALDVDELQSTDHTDEQVLDVIAKRRGWYDPRLVAALEKMFKGDSEVQEVIIDELEDGMVFDQDVVTGAGQVLVDKGEEVQPVIRQMLANLAKTRGAVQEPIRVRCCKEAVSTLVEAT